MNSVQIAGAGLSGLSVVICQVKRGCQESSQTCRADQAAEQDFLVRGIEPSFADHTRLAREATDGQRDRGERQRSSFYLPAGSIEPCAIDGTGITIRIKDPAARCRMSFLPTEARGHPIRLASNVSPL